jgi:transposase
MSKVFKKVFVHLKMIQWDLNTLPKTAVVVMETTTYYHDRLARYLFKQGVLVLVANHLFIKRFIQLKLAKVKTDKSNAKAIC